MTSHPQGITVTIVGTKHASNGRTCEEHDVCGNVLELDMVVRLRRVQVQIDGKEEAAIAAFWITDGIDRCRVGFLPKHFLKHSRRFEGCIAQITDVYTDDSDSPTKRRLSQRNGGHCVATIIDAVRPIPSFSPPQKNQD